MFKNKQKKLNLKLKTKILVSGGSGFIGQNIVKELTTKYRVVIIDNKSSKAIHKKMLYNKSKVKFYKADICDLKKISQIFKKEKFKMIIHCAAHFANQNSIDNPHKDLNYNIKGTLNLLTFAKAHNIRKFIYLSSSCVYSSKLNLIENSNIRPIETPYAISKYSAELYVEFFSSFYKLKSTVIRVFNTYGPGELTHKYRNVIPKFIDHALKNKDITITGKGNEVRDFTFVDDLVNLIKEILICKKKFLVVNSCTGRKTTINQLAQKIIKITKSKSKIKKIQKRNWDLIKVRSGSTTIRKKYLSQSKITSLETGLKKTISWYKKAQNL